MDFKSVGQTISKYAPLLGAVVGGAPGGAIGALVASAFGADPAKPQAILDKIETDPNAPVKLVEIQANCKTELQRIAAQIAENELKYTTQQHEIAFQNTKDARDNNSRSHSWMPEIVSVLSIIGFFGCIVMIAQFHQEERDEQVLYMLLGSVSMAFGAVINYWLGSSAGSKAKDFMIKK